LNVDVDEVCRMVLASGCAEESVEDEVRQACARLCPGHGKAAARSVMEMIDAFAPRSGGSRLAAVRKLAEAEATIVRESYGSLDEMPPEMRERVARLMASGKTGTVRHVTVRHADGTTGGLPPDVLDEIEKARAAHGGTLPVGFRVTRRITPWWRPWLLLGIIVLATVAFAGLKLLSDIRHIEKTRGKGAQAIRIAELEEELAGDPGRLDAARELAGLYVNRLITIQSLIALREANLDAVGDADGLDAQKDGRIASYEEGMQITASAEEAAGLAGKGLALSERALGSADLMPADQGTFQVVRGYCLLALDRPEEARQASEAAAELDDGDIRPYLLNAAIAEARKDYAMAVRELETALKDLNAWVGRGPSLLQEFVWGLGPTPTADRREWERHRANITRRVGDSIQARLIMLRALAGAQARGLDV
jgi:tetratricopeptide (TPR) repeat protein